MAIKIILKIYLVFMEFQHNNAPIRGKFSPNVVRRVLGPAVTCQQIWHAKKNAFQDAGVLMINS